MALCLPNGEAVQHCNSESQRAAERLLELVERCLADAEVAPGQLDRVAVGIGPGSFTGLRVGIALAQGLALGLDRPLVGVPSLQALARAAVPVAEGSSLVAVVDAHRGELFAAGHDPEGAPLWGPVAFPAQEAARAIAARMHSPYALIGRAALGLGEALLPDVDAAEARFIGWLGALAPPTPDVAPLYARGPDAILPTLPPNPLAG